MEITKKRIEWIDVAKGISIILVVYGHSGLNNVPYIGAWLHSFRMPFFFFVSGLLFSGYKHETIAPFIKKRIKTLYRPYFIFSALLMLGIWLLGDPTYSAPSHMLQYLKTGWEGWALWFIPVLSLTEILFYYTIRLKIKNLYKIVILIGMAIIGRLLYIYDIPNPYNIGFVLTAVLFYGLGSLSKTLVIDFSKSKLYKLLLGSAVALLLSFVYNFSPGLPEFAINNMASIWIYPAAIFGALFMCTFAMFLERISNPIVGTTKMFIIYMGKNSYIVLAFHQIILQLLGKSGVFHTGSLQRLTMWVLLVILIYVIVNYCPAVIGRQRTITQKATN